MIVMRAPWTTSGMSRPARLAPHTMMVTSAAATAAAVTFGEILDMLPPLDELRHDSRDSTRDCRYRSDDSDELSLRHIRTTPHRLTLLQLQKPRLDAIQTTEDPVDLSITHTPNHNRRHGLDAPPQRLLVRCLPLRFGIRMYAITRTSSHHSSQRGPTTRQHGHKASPSHTQKHTPDT